MIVVDTGAAVALVDAADEHHRAVRSLYERDPVAWVLPWAILPEVDYLLGKHVSDRARRLFVDDLASGAFAIEWGDAADLERAAALDRQYATLELGLVDAAVMAIAERLEAQAIATLDLRHFGAVTLATKPLLLPRDG
ncbi:MAG: PIN domain-containing protein [Gemmatimonadota bacterium]|nr:PIN domain-containing protein [Gemmatimonadota bacterium]MDH5196470.1 PIN domain-containing protein [Gemmatimonadota bacterium]